MDLETSHFTLYGLNFKASFLPMQSPNAQAIATSLSSVLQIPAGTGYPPTQLSIWINDDHFVLQTAHTTELSHPKYI